MSDPDSDRTESSTPDAADGAVVAPDGGATTDTEFDGPPDDQEMPITEHLEEMLKRLFVVLVAASVVTAAAFPITDELVMQMWYDIHEGSLDPCQATPEHTDCTPPHVYGPLEFALVRLQLAAIAGLIVAFPVGIYETYKFMRPGLYPKERRYYLSTIPMSFVLGIVGVLFAYFIILPLLFAIFITYSDGIGAVDIAFQLSDTLNIILVMMAMLAVIFQIPLAIILAVLMGITTRRWLERRRIYFYGAFATVAFLFGPDPTGMAPIMLAVTMVLLFEGTLLLLRWTGR